MPADDSEPYGRRSRSGRTDRSSLQDTGLTDAEIEYTDPRFRFADREARLANGDATIEDPAGYEPDDDYAPPEAPARRSRNGRRSLDQEVTERLAASDSPWSSGSETSATRRSAEPARRSAGALVPPHDEFDQPELPIWATAGQPVAGPIDDDYDFELPARIDFSDADAMVDPGDDEPDAEEFEPETATTQRITGTPLAGDRPRPAKPRRWSLDLGRRLRSVAGVDEVLLDRVPQERARYSALGGVVIGTALIAAFSMWFAITEAVGETSAWVLLPTLIWGLFIYNFDRWLISSAVGTHWHKRIGPLVMRVLMAVLFGVIIAEPLVLRVFQTAIVKNIQDERAADLATLQSNLIRCNPEPDSPAGAKTPPNCAGYVLTFPSTPGSLATQLASKRADEAKLQAEIDTDTKQLNTLNNEARLECVGAKGPGLSGQKGVGPNCLRLRGEADAYAKAHPIATETSQLTTLQQQISTLEASVATSQTDFLKQRAQLIDQQVAVAQSHQGAIGILERMGALSQLARTSTTLLIGTWLVRLLFIMVDCMPILVKYFGGITTYDRLVERQLANADLEHAAEFDTAYDERVAQLHRRRAEIDVELREHRAELGSRVSRAVHELATEYVDPSARSGAVYNSRGRTSGLHATGINGHAGPNGQVNGGNGRSNGAAIGRSPANGS